MIWICDIRLMFWLIFRSSRNQVVCIFKTTSSYRIFLHVGRCYPWSCWIYHWFRSCDGHQDVIFYVILMLRSEGLWQCWGFWKDCQVNSGILILLGPFMCHLYARSLSTSIGLSVCRESSIDTRCEDWDGHTCTIRYLFFQCTTNHLIRIVNFDHFIEFGYEFKLFAIHHLSGCIFEDLQQHLNHYGLVWFFEYDLYWWLANKLWKNDNGCPRSKNLTTIFRPWTALLKSSLHITSLVVWKGDHFCLKE
jgi:hypothetical protein